MEHKIVHSFSEPRTIRAILEVLGIESNQMEDERTPSFDLLREACAKKQWSIDIQTVSIQEILRPRFLSTPRVISYSNCVIIFLDFGKYWEVRKVNGETLRILSWRAIADLFQIKNVEREFFNKSFEQVIAKKAQNISSIEMSDSDARQLVSLDIGLLPFDLDDVFEGETLLSEITFQVRVQPSATT